jgi:glycosyltransferase involved in cell wall biosynthesis
MLWLVEINCHGSDDRMSKISLTGDLMVPDVSIVIRAYNEAGPLRRLLEWTRRQEFEGAVEVIVVDNGSTDGTAAVAREFGARVVTLPQGEFSYPKSLNLGVEAARAPVVVCLVAHAYPDTTDWLARGLRHFADRRVAVGLARAWAGVRLEPVARAGGDAACVARDVWRHQPRVAAGIVGGARL